MRVDSIIVEYSVRFESSRENLPRDLHSQCEHSKAYEVWGRSSGRRARPGKRNKQRLLNRFDERKIKRDERERETAEITGERERENQHQQRGTPK